MTSGAANRRQAEIAFHRATAWRRAAKVERAEEGFRRAIELDPSYLPPYIDLAEILEAAHRFEEAFTVSASGEHWHPLDGGLRGRRTRLEARLMRAPEPRPIDPPPPVAARPGMPHILFHTDASSIYGAEQVNHALMLGLSAAGYRVSCAHLPIDGDHRLVNERAAAGIDHVWLSPDEVGDDEAGTARPLFGLAQSQRVIGATNPDLVLFGDRSPLSSATPKHAAHIAGVPFLVIVHAVERSWADTYRDYLPSLERAYRAAEDVVAVSTENLDLLRGVFGLPDDKGRVIFCGRPPAFFEPRDESARAALRRNLQIPDGATAFLTVARLDWVKGHHHLLAALEMMAGDRALAQLYLLWAGAGCLDSLFRARVIAMGLADRVRFLGECSDVPALLDAADAFILPSHFEGMPLSVMEAMGKGLPVAATAVSGTPEELGDTGTLLPSPEIDARATVEKIVDVMRRWVADPAERARVGDACRSRAARLFREERMVDDYRRLLSDVLTRRAGHADSIAT